MDEFYYNNSFKSSPIFKDKRVFYEFYLNLLTSGGGEGQMIDMPMPSLKLCPELMFLDLEGIRRLISARHVWSNVI